VRATISELVSDVTNAVGLSIFLVGG